VPGAACRVGAEPGLPGRRLKGYRIRREDMLHFGVHLNVGHASVKVRNHVLVSAISDMPPHTATYAFMKESKSQAYYPKIGGL
jgi:hypothetical protein